MLAQITALFIDGAHGFGEDVVGLFDDVLSRLIEEIETKARIELANRLAPVGNAPVKVVRRLATDNEISVAGPLLRQSPRLNEADLIGVAQTKSTSAGARAQGVNVTPRPRARRRTLIPRHSNDTMFQAKTAPG